MTLVTGTAGAGKTVFAAQYLAEGVRRGEPGGFVTFEERPEATMLNLNSLGLDIKEWEAAGTWSFVNASPRFDEPVVVGGSTTCRRCCCASATRRADRRGAGGDRLGRGAPRAVRAPGAGARRPVPARLPPGGGRRDVGHHRGAPRGRRRHLAAGLRGVLADNVIVLRNALENEKRRRTIEVLKLRGGAHQRGEHLFTLVPGRGLVVVPHEHVDFDYGTSTRRLPSGNPGLDAMLHGGFYDKSLVLVAGPTGAGKSLITTQFVGAGAANGERSLLISFEESRAQMGRNAAAWGLDFDEMERTGDLRIMVAAPESAPLEDHLMRMKEVIEEFQPDRVAIDSLTALQRISTVKTFREYLLGLTFYIKNHALLGLLTTTRIGLLDDRSRPTCTSRPAATPSSCCGMWVSKERCVAASAW